MRRIKTPANYEYKKDSAFWHSKKPSLTIVGEAYTIPELMQRAQNGLLENIERQGIYDEDPDHEDPDFNRLAGSDIVDQKEAIDASIQKEVSKKQQKQAKALAEATKAKRESAKPEPQKAEEVSETKEE